MARGGDPGDAKRPLRPLERRGHGPPSSSPLKPVTPRRTAPIGARGWHREASWSSSPIGARLSNLGQCLTWTRGQRGGSPPRPALGFRPGRSRGIRAVRQVDAKRLSIVGASLGGTFAALATPLARVESPALRASVLLDPARYVGVKKKWTSEGVAASLDVATLAVAAQEAPAPDPKNPPTIRSGP